MLVKKKKILMHKMKITVTNVPKKISILVIEKYILYYVLLSYICICF